MLETLSSTLEVPTIPSNYIILKQGQTKNINQPSTRFQLNNAQKSKKDLQKREGQQKGRENQKYFPTRKPV